MAFTKSAIYVYKNQQNPGHLLVSVLFPPPHTHLKTSTVALLIQWFPQIPEYPLLHPNPSSMAKLSMDYLLFRRVTMAKPPAAFGRARAGGRS